MRAIGNFIVCVLGWFLVIMPVIVGMLVVIGIIYRDIIGTTSR